MSSRNDRYVFETARPEDGPEILEILEDVDFKGKISLTFTRRPDAYASFKREGREVDVLVSRDARENRITAVAAASVNRMFLDGEPADIGYVFGLRVRREYRRRYLLLPRGFRYLFDLHRDKAVPFYLTTILSENLEARRLLEKRRPSMPVYRHFGDYETYALVTGRRAGRCPEFRFRSAGEDDLPALAAFLDAQGRRFQFFPVLDPGALADPSARPGVRDFCLLLDGRGEIAAAGAVWDQREYKQYVVAGYGGAYRVLAPVSFAFPLFGYPKLVRPGSVLDYFTLSFWAVRDDDPRVFDRFLRHVAEITGRFSYFVLGVDTRHPLREVLRKRPHILYPARMYLVHAPENEPRVNQVGRDRVPYLEIGRL